MIIDLHCDLLSFLTEKPGRTIDDPLSRCSLPQMVEGRVKLQTLALFSQTGPGSVAQGAQQAAVFQQLLTTPHFAPVSQVQSESAIGIIPAFENASAFALEDEPLDHSLQRLQQMHEQLGHIFYITMTWDGENRFGGGVGSPIGLKADGKTLLQFLSGKKIAIDLSHTSDRLAAEIFEYIDALHLKIPLLASHSNFRAITPMPRNLPDSIAAEIIRRKGLIGLNFFAPFIDPCDPNRLAHHVQHALSLGGHDALCFGADFFCLQDFTSLAKKYPGSVPFFPAYQNASCYPPLLDFLAKECALPEKNLHAIAHGNAIQFLRNFIF